MPRKPKHPCAYPGCPELTDERYCDKHKKQRGKEYEQYGRKYNRSERYGASWRKVRERYAAAHPYCEECFANGKMVPMEHVHHIVPLEEGGTNDTDNLMSLCKSCHSKLHAKRGDRWHKTQPKGGMNPCEKNHK